MNQFALLEKENQDLVSRMEKMEEQIASLEKSLDVAAAAAATEVARPMETSNPAVPQQKGNDDEDDGVDLFASESEEPNFICNIPSGRNGEETFNQDTTPPASPVLPQCDSSLVLLKRHPVLWQGLLALKNDQVAVQMHYIYGNPIVARDSLPLNNDGSTLGITQIMRLEQTQVDGVKRKIQMDNEHCMLMALPFGQDNFDMVQQTYKLRSRFITYLQQKQAAGIVNIPAPGSQKIGAYVAFIFTESEFARIAPHLLDTVSNLAHLLIVIAPV